jgi:hypothetical protein
MASTLIENRGNTSLITEGSFDPSGVGGSIYLAYKGATLKLTGNTAWSYIPFAAETNPEKDSFIVLWKYHDSTSNPCFQAHAFDLLTGIVNGGYTNDGRRVTLAESMTIPGEQFCWRNEETFLSHFDDIVNPSENTNHPLGSSQAGESRSINAPSIYGISNAAKFTNFNPKTDEPIQINLESFTGSTGNLRIAKKTKQVAKLTKSETDFIYDQQTGYLYYNENGNASGFGDGGVFAILEGKPKVGLGDFEFV